MIGLESTPRHIELVRRVYGAELVPPGVILEVDRVEARAHKNEKLWVGEATSAALAANISCVAARVIQPTLGQQVTTLAVIEWLVLSGGAAAQVFDIRTGSITADTVATFPFRDQLEGNSFTQLVTRRQAAAPGTHLLSVTAPINETLFLRFPFVLRPTRSAPQSLIVCGAAVNVAVTAAFIGYERSAREEEHPLTSP